MTPFPFRRLAKRDVALAAVGAGLWALESAIGSRGVLGKVVAVAAGASIGVTGFAFHEWGHLVGAVVSGGVVHRPATLSPFLFNFDVAKSSRGQFLAMSLGGFAATAASTAFVLRWVPRATLSGRVALAATAAGLAVTVVAELPVFLRVLAGGPLPSGPVYVGGPQRDR